MKSRMVVVGLVLAGITSASATDLLAGCGACSKAEKKKETACETCVEKHVEKATAKQGEATVSTEGLQALLNAKVALVLLDARAGKYDDGKRIPGAKALNEKSSAEEVARIAPDKNGLVVTYCAGLSCGASHKLAERLRKDGYTSVVEYPEGIAGWIAGGKAVEETKKGGE